MVNNSQQVRQLKAYQDLANNYMASKAPIQKKGNHTGLPDQLKTGVEHLSGMAMDDVKVHYNSAKPAQLQAHAYAQGTDIHLGPGQEKHLPHEAWHVVQQKQGRVKPTMQMKGKVNINDDEGLEQEADKMGAKAMQSKVVQKKATSIQGTHKGRFSSGIIQRARGPGQRGAARRQWGDASRYGRRRRSAAQIPLGILARGALLRARYRRHGGNSTQLRQNNYVYVATSRGTIVYVGITNNPVRRQGGHGDRFHLHVLNPGHPLSRIEVRGIEQALINSGRGNLLNQNIAESISDTHAYYDTAVRFGMAFYRWAQRTNRDNLRGG